MSNVKIIWVLWIFLVKMVVVFGALDNSQVKLTDNTESIVNSTNLPEFKEHSVDSAIKTDTKEKRTHINLETIVATYSDETLSTDFPTSAATEATTLADTLQLGDSKIEGTTQIEPTATRESVILKKLIDDQQDASTTSSINHNSTVLNSEKSIESYPSTVRPHPNEAWNQTTFENKTEIMTNSSEEQKDGTVSELLTSVLSTQEQTSALVGVEEEESGATLEEDTVEKSNVSCIISNDTEFGWLVKLVDNESKRQVCTGVLITDEDVLTPASCFLENTTRDFEVGSLLKLPKHLLAIAGGGIDTDCMQVRNVSLIYPHKGYYQESADHDFAFIKVIPPFDVDEENIPDLRYHLDVINSEGSLVNIHNNEPFCESPYFVDEGINARVSEERHLLGMRIDDCMLQWNCSTDYTDCLSYLLPSSHACLKPLTPRNCTNRDRGAPLICDDVFLGYLDTCKGELPMIFHGLSKAILFLELKDDHVQPPHFRGLPH